MMSGSLGLGGSGSARGHRSKDDKDRKRSLLRMIPMKPGKLKEALLEKLISSGQLALFKHILRERLHQYGWVYDMRLAYSEQIKKIGVENVNVSHLMTDMLPVGRELFDQSPVKPKLQSILKNFALLYFNSDPSALVPQQEPVVPQGPIQYQGRDVKPEPRKRPHSHDRHVLAHGSKRSRSSNRSKSKNRVNPSRSDSQRSRSSSEAAAAAAAAAGPSGTTSTIPTSTITSAVTSSASSSATITSAATSSNRNKSPFKNPLPPRPITPQIPILSREKTVVETKSAVKLPPPPKQQPLSKNVKPLLAPTLPPPRFIPKPILLPPPPPPPKEEPPELEDDAEPDGFINPNADEEDEEELPDI